MNILLVFQQLGGKLCAEGKSYHAQIVYRSDADLRNLRSVSCFRDPCDAGRSIVHSGQTLSRRAVRPLTNYKAVLSCS